MRRQTVASPATFWPLRAEQQHDRHQDRNPGQHHHDVSPRASQRLFLRRETTERDHLVAAHDRPRRFLDLKLRRWAIGRGGCSGRLSWCVCDACHGQEKSLTAERALRRMSQQFGADRDRPETGRARDSEQRLRMECRRRKRRVGGRETHGRTLRTRAGCAATDASSPDRTGEGRGGLQTRSPWPASRAAPRACARPSPAR